MTILNSRTFKVFQGPVLTLSDIFEGVGLWGKKWEIKHLPLHHNSVASPSFLSNRNSKILLNEVKLLSCLYGPVHIADNVRYTLSLASRQPLLKYGRLSMAEVWCLAC